VKKVRGFRSYYGFFFFVIRMVDSLAVALMLQVSVWSREVVWDDSYTMLACASVLVTLLMFEAVNLYVPRRGAQIFSELKALFLGWGLTAGLLLSVSFLIHKEDVFARDAVVLWLLVTPFVLASMHMGGRTCLRFFRSLGYNQRTAVIVGAGDLGVQLAQRILDAEWMGVKLLGFVDDSNDNKSGESLPLPVLGSTRGLMTLVNKQKIDRVYIALPMRAETKMINLVESLKDTAATVYLVPDIFIFDLLVSRLMDVDGMPVVSLCETPHQGPFGFVKRIEDLLLTTTILLLITPLLVLISIAIKLTSPGPVIFKQRRYGLDGEEFLVWKFRSMSVCEEGAQAVQATRNDARVTPLGGFLRRTSLDELPQFINVLQGSMSVVGPRPHPIALNEEYRKRIQGYMWRHKVKPGITGWAQVNGYRGETDTLEKMEKRIALDLDYIRNWSLWMDVKIVVMTIFKGFTHPNAY
jgi:putative colanic acid biosynthesis UDP-glucose lipid carrier transferase